MESLLWLIGAHFIGDFALQSDWIARMKAKRIYVLIAHVVIWTTVCCIPLKYFGLLSIEKVIFLFVGHLAADWIKSKFPADDEHWHLIYRDQAWHLLQIFVVWYL